MKFSQVSVNSSEAKDLIKGLISSDRFMKQVAPVCSSHLDVFQETPIYDPVLWMVEYAQRYDTAPKKAAAKYFKERCAHVDDAKKRFIKKLVLRCLKELHDSGGLNEDYAIDRSLKWLQELSLKFMCSRVSVALDSSRMDLAEEEVGKFRLIERSFTDAIDPFQDWVKISGAFEDEVEPLFEYPGKLGRLWNDQFTREALVGLMGPEKRGKSWWLMDLALRAYRYRNNVAFFEVGDMSERQWLRRLHVMISGRSYRAKYCGDILVPQLDCMKNQTGDCSSTCPYAVRDQSTGLLEPFDEAPVGYNACCNCRGDRDFEGAVWYKKVKVGPPLQWREAYKRAQLLLRKAQGKKFKFSVHPNSSVSVNDLQNRLDMWRAFDGFTPDVVVIDYADILAPLDGKKDQRGQQNDTWKALRRLSQEYRCLVITASQADAESYAKHTLGLSNFSEDKRKYGHVTAMFSLNQMPEEKRQGIMRIGNLVVREDEFDLTKTVSVLQCLNIGKPFLDSF